MKISLLFNNFCGGEGLQNPSYPPLDMQLIVDTYIIYQLTLHDMARYKLNVRRFTLLKLHRFCNTVIWIVLTKYKIQI